MLTIFGGVYRYRHHVIFDLYGHDDVRRTHAQYFRFRLRLLTPRHDDEDTSIRPTNNRAGRLPKFGKTTKLPPKFT